MTILIILALLLAVGVAFSTNKLLRVCCFHGTIMLGIYGSAWAVLGGGV